MQERPRGDVDPTLEEQPSRAGEEPSDDRIRHEPDQPTEPEPPDHQEHDPAQDRDDEGGGDDGQEDVGMLVVLQTGYPCEMREVGGLRRGGGGDEPEHGRCRVLHAADDASGSGPPGHERERQRSRSEVQADAVRKAGREQAAEDESGERDREHATRPHR